MKSGSKAKVKTTELQPTNGSEASALDQALTLLSTQQAKAVTRMVTAELAGESIESLFVGAQKICARTTYYSRERDGWIHQPKFQLALSLARSAAKHKFHDEEVGDAVAELKRATLPAAKDLHRQILGDQEAIDQLAKFARDQNKLAVFRISAMLSLSEIGTRQATQALVALLEDPNEEIQVEAAKALGRSAAGVNLQRRMADIAVLNRADKQTASKSDVVPMENIEEVRARRWDQIGAMPDVDDE